MPEFTKCPDSRFYRNRWDTREYIPTLEKEFVSPLMIMIREYRPTDALEGLAVIDWISPAPGAGERADKDRWRMVRAMIDDRKAEKTFFKVGRLIARYGDTPELFAAFDALDDETKDVYLQVTRWLLETSSPAFPSEVKVSAAYLRFGSPAHKMLLEAEEAPATRTSRAMKRAVRALSREGKELRLEFPAEEIMPALEQVELIRFLKRAKVVQNLDAAVAEMLDKMGNLGSC